MSDRQTIFILSFLLMNPIHLFRNFLGRVDTEEWNDKQIYKYFH